MNKTLKIYRIHYIHIFTVRALLIVIFLSELATFKSIHYMFQCKNKTYRVYIDCSWSHGLSEYRILKFPENWVNLQSAKEELLYWWSLQIWYCLFFILQPCWIKDIYMILKYHYCFLPSQSLKICQFPMFFSPRITSFGVTCFNITCLTAPQIAF